MLEGQKNALKIFWGGRAGRDLFNSIGKFGHIIATEVTYGENGWHPHFHILLFLNNSVNIKDCRLAISKLWQKSCVSKGLPEPSLDYGVDLRGGDKAYE